MKYTNTKKFAQSGQCLGCNLKKKECKNFAKGNFKLLYERMKI